ncbi:lycopene cyclase domain-containing protein [Agromyces intestinalis]|uniref:Lycopene cyclase domain-containing protein n=1 Tax=Agromyces intestinalis TaxID=2592652 RepID=A0A5C1YFX6_9MICO|nr:lycopene cyclase domain-containing protein [Agromyces intestinalis]QEO14330.1 lycopene cyclase domain-containing protein [Agromyces intestinalis]
MSVVYLSALAVSLAGVATVDARFRLFVWRAPRRAAAVLGITLAFLLGWDAAGIALGVFFRVDNAISTGIVLAPELPLEEPVFLLFLAYLAMVLYTGALRLLAARRAGRAAPTRASQPRSDAAEHAERNPR